MANILKMKEIAEGAMINLMNLTADDNVLVITDEPTKTIGDAFFTAAKEHGCTVDMYLLPEKQRPLSEIPAQLDREIDGKTVVLNMIQAVPDETPFRLKLCLRVEGTKSIRMAHSPGITESMMIDGPMNVDYARMRETAVKMLEKLANAKSVHITAPAGTDVVLAVDGRPFKSEVEISEDMATNLPCGEIYCAPLETEGSGILVIDGTIGGIDSQHMSKPLTVFIKNGRLEKLACENQRLIEEVEKITGIDDEARIIGELGIGINPAARLVGNMLEDEKAFGTAHIAFGNNCDFPGGQNRSKTHNDFLFYKPTIEVTYKDNSNGFVVKDGEFQI